MVIWRSYGHCPCGESDTYTYHSCLFNLHQPLYHHYIDYQLYSLTVIAIIQFIAYIPTIFDRPIETIRVYNIAYLPPRGNSLELPIPLLTLNHTFSLSNT